MEITKDFIKFVAEVVALLVIFSVSLGEQGIISNTFNYMNFAEPIMLQNYISSSISAGSQTPGDYYSNVKTSSNLPHEVKLFYKDGKPYVNVIASSGFSRTNFVPNDPTPIITDCKVKEMDITLPEKAGQDVMVSKYTDSDGACTFYVTVGSGLAAFSEDNT